MNGSDRITGRGPMPVPLISQDQNEVPVSELVNRIAPALASVSVVRAPYRLEGSRIDRRGKVDRAVRRILELDRQAD